MSCTPSLDNEIVTENPDGTFHVNIRQNAQLRFVVTYKVDGRPFDLTGRTGKAEFKRTQDEGSELVATATVSVLNPATSGKLEVVIGATVARTMSGKGFFDVLAPLTADPDDVRFVMAGSWSIFRGVTS